MNYTNIDVASFMLDELLVSGSLYPYDFVETIQNTYGEDFTSFTDRGSPKISDEVKREFKKLINDHDIVWDRRELCWRVNS